MHAHGTSSVSHPGSFLKTVGGVRVDRELVSRQEAMHAHGTSSVSHSGSFLKTVGGVRVDCELVSSGWQLSEQCEDRGPWHRGGSAEPGAGEARKEGTVGSFFCGVGCGGVELRVGRVGGMRVGKGAC